MSEFAIKKLCFVLLLFGLAACGDNGGSGLTEDPEVDDGANGCEGRAGQPNDDDSPIIVFDQRHEMSIINPPASC